MRVYVGFGFNTDHISDEVLIALMKKYDRKRYDKLKKKVSKPGHEKRRHLCKSCFQVFY